MISYVAKLINLFASTIQYGLLIASLLGKLIVSTITGISSVILKIIENIIIFFQIVYEDNIFILTEELPNFANDVIQTATNQLHSLQSGISVLFYHVYYRFCAIISTLKWIVDVIIVIVCEVLFLMRNAVIFVGDTLWFILAFIPVHLPEILKAIFKKLFEIIVSGIIDAYMTLLKITNFLTDVPLESFIGITGAIVIIRLCIHFKQTILTLASTYYWSLVRKLCYYYYTFYNYFIDTEVREITLMSSGPNIENRREMSHPLNTADVTLADTLCVICQERQKCVLTLPCRHICLCTECCMRLYGYQRTCPICRTFIYHSVTVYL